VTTFRYFAPCPRGLEEPLAAELAGLGAGKIAQTPGGVAFEGDLAVCYRANLHSRIASRVLLHLDERHYRTEQDVYAIAHAQPWERWFNVDQHIRVDLTATKSPLKSLEFATLRIKDGVCDRFRDRGGERPSVDTKNPDVRIFGYLTDRLCTIYLDTSGEALFKRGWRLEKGEAPLRENLASGILALLQWKPGQPLFDPMCGSGTFLIEAALAALGQAPGRARRFGFEQLKNFDASLWQRIRTAAAQAPSIPSHALQIAGSDISGDMLIVVRQNLERAGIDPALVPLKQVEAEHVKPPFAVPGVLVANPPYGERMGFRGALASEAEASAAFYAAFGSSLKKGFAGWKAAIFTADRDVPKQLRLQPARKYPLFNGALECRLFTFDMVAGQNRKPTADEQSAAG
jgi:putative N6-adenine-specific DNA methylase